MALPGVGCLRNIAQVRHIKGQNSKHNLQFLLLFHLKYQLQSAFCAQPAVLAVQAHLQVLFTIWKLS